jgi:branched-chain amino acid transport system substrate-binding protein
LAISKSRAKGKGVPCFFVGHLDLTGKACSPNTIHWSYDTWALAQPGKALVQSGADTWFFVTADYAFGYSIERDVEAVVLANGGKVLGKVRHPFPTTSDFSSFLLRAQASHAKVVGLANAGADMINTIEQGTRLGIVQGGQRMVALLAFLTDVHALGLNKAQGLILSESFYWDLNDQTREWSARFARRHWGAMPAMPHAGTYAAVLHYLKAIDAEGRRRHQGDREDEGAPRRSSSAKGSIRQRPQASSEYLFGEKRPSRRGHGTCTSCARRFLRRRRSRPIDQGDCPMVKSSRHDISAEASLRSPLDALALTAPFRCRERPARGRCWSAC